MFVWKILGSKIGITGSKLVYMTHLKWITYKFLFDPVYSILVEGTQDQRCEHLALAIFISKSNWIFQHEQKM